MQYNQPYDQPSSPNAPYINGNPAAGIQGSIVPAAAVEYPQRELVSVISAAGLTPTNSNLAQLLQALACVDVLNKLKLATNQGTNNQWSATIPQLPVSPPPVGTALWFKPGIASVIGGTTFSLNGNAASPVTLPNGTAISVGDVTANCWCLLFYDGANWQIMAGTTRSGQQLPQLQQITNWYVNQATGSDTQYDGTSATPVTGTPHGPFLSIQRAANEVLKYNMNGYDQYINVADGTYAAATFQQQNGAGTIHIVGNVANPQNCNVSSNQSEICPLFVAGGSYTVAGFRLATTGSALDGLAVNYGKVQISGNMRFGPCVRAHMSAAFGGNLAISNGPNVTITIESGANASCHLLSSINGILNAIGPPFVTAWPNLMIQGPVTLGAFVLSEFNSVLSVYYQTITGASNVTGQKYLAEMNGTIDSLGGGVNYYPGNSAGSLSTGGQFQ